MGDGMLTSFWNDTWVGHVPLWVTFHRPYPIAKKKMGKSMGDWLTGG